MTVCSVRERQGDLSTREASKPQAPAATFSLARQRRRKSRSAVAPLAGGLQANRLGLCMQTRTNSTGSHWRSHI